jgi:hypothetical protein
MNDAAVAMMIFLQSMFSPCRKNKHIAELASLCGLHICFCWCFTFLPIHQDNLSAAMVAVIQL